MELDKYRLILNEYEVVEGIVKTGVIPSYYSNTGILVNRLYRYFYEVDKDNAVDLLKQQLKKLKIVYSDKAVDETIEKYTIVQPLKRTNGINIYQEEVDSINKISGRENQRVAFGLLVIQKVLSPHSNRLYLDNWNDVFKVVKIGNQDQRNSTLYQLQQQKAIDVPLFDNYLEVKIAKTDGKINTTIKDGFDKIDGWFDKIFAENTNLETIVMVDLNNDEVRVFKHMGYRGTANILKQEGINIKGTHIKDCCSLKREQLNGITYFVLDEEWCKQGDYELRKANYIDAMIKVRHILSECKRNPHKKGKLYIRIDGGDEILTVRIK